MTSRIKDIWIIVVKLGLMREASRANRIKEFIYVNLRCFHSEISRVYRINNPEIAGICWKMKKSWENSADFRTENPGYEAERCKNRGRQNQGASENGVLPAGVELSQAPALPAASGTPQAFLNNSSEMKYSDKLPDSWKRVANSKTDIRDQECCIFWKTVICLLY